MLSISQLRRLSFPQLTWPSICIYIQPLIRNLFHHSGSARIDSLLRHAADKSPSGSPFATGHEARVAQAIRRISASFPDASRAEEAMQKIHELRDGHIFKGFATLCAAGTTLENAVKVAKDTVQRIGSKGFVGEFAK